MAGGAFDVQEKQRTSHKYIQQTKNLPQLISKREGRSRSHLDGVREGELFFLLLAAAEKENRGWLKGEATLSKILGALQAAA